MTPINVVNVKGLQGDARKSVCYVGRQFAGWPGSRWGNPFRPGDRTKASIELCLQAFRTTFLDRSPERIDASLAELWEDCDHGAKPLGCWCVNAQHGDGQPIVCHAQILAELLTNWVKAKEGS